MSICKENYNPECDTRITMNIVGIGDYGKNIIAQLKQNGISNVKYDQVVLNANQQEIKKITYHADIVFFIADINSGFSLSNIIDVVSMYQERSEVTILLIPDAGFNNNIAFKDDPLLHKLLSMPDKVIKISGQIQPSENNDQTNDYKQIYHCMKLLTDICGDRRGLLNTDLGDIVGSLRQTGTGYIGFGEATGNNAVAEAVEKAVDSITAEKLNKASSVIATISYKDCSINDMIPFYEKIQINMTDTVVFNYNIYFSDTVDDLCSVIILAII